MGAMRQQAACSSGPFRQAASTWVWSPRHKQMACSTLVRHSRQSPPVHDWTPDQNSVMGLHAAGDAGSLHSLPWAWLDYRQHQDSVVGCTPAQMQNGCIARPCA